MKEERSNEAGRKSKNERIEEFLLRNYLFRFNTIKCRAEYTDMRDMNNYFPVSRITINSFRRELDKVSGIITSGENLRSILESNFAPKVNPIREYFQKLPRVHFTNEGHIIRLASTVTVVNSDKWLEYLIKWLVAVVANALCEVGCQNHTCLVLTGEQGRYKTTWLDHLCPTSLKSYLYTGKIDPQCKDTQTYIAEYLFINIDDQLKALNKRDENELKNLITTPCVKYRRPYDIFIEEYSHLASFMASVNGNDFLTDPTGSRRFLPFEVLKIDIEAALTINMDDVFSEVMFLYDSNCQYWFDEKEIAELYVENSRFNVQTTEYEFLLIYFEKPMVKNLDSFMTTAQILSHLRNCVQINLSEKKMGEALKKAGFERAEKRINASYPVYGYYIKKVFPIPLP